MVLEAESANSDVPALTWVSLTSSHNSGLYNGEACAPRIRRGQPCSFMLTLSLELSEVPQKFNLF